MQNEALVVIDIGGPPDEPQAVHKCEALILAVQRERENPTESMRELTLRGFVISGAGQAGIVHLVDLLMTTLQVMSHSQSVFAASLGAQAQGFEPQRLQVCIVGRKTRAQVSVHIGAHPRQQRIRSELCHPGSDLGITPPTEVAPPEMYFVEAMISKSAPKSFARNRYGVVTVPSTIMGTFLACAIFATASTSMTWS